MNPYPNQPRNKHAKENAKEEENVPISASDVAVVMESSVLHGHF